MSPHGQHIELGIAEHNLFLQLAALGLSGRSSARGCCRSAPSTTRSSSAGSTRSTTRCYQDARFILVATPSGISLAPEGGAHQSVVEPLIGLAQPGLTGFEPAYADELAVLLRWAFGEIQRDGGESVYFRLSTRPVEQPERDGRPALADAIRRRRLLAARAGAGRGAGDRLLRCGRARGARRLGGDSRRTCQAWACSRSPRPTACTAIGGTRAMAGDPGSPAAAGAAAARCRHRHRRRQPSGDAVLARQFVGQRGTCRSESTISANPATFPDLYRAYGIDQDAILDAAARACLLAIR